MLEDKAKEVADDPVVFQPLHVERKRFLAKFRLSLRCKTRIGQITPVDSAQVVQKVLTVWVHNAGAEKKRMTVMLLSDMHGNRKTPFAVFKQPPSTVPATETCNHQNQDGFGRGLWAEVKQLMDNHDVQIYANAKGWWNQRLWLLWVQYHFGSRDNLGEKVLLLWDDFSGHWTPLVKMYAAMIGVVLLKIPPGYMASCQPADIAWMKPFKLVLRSLWVDNLQSQVRAHQERSSQTQFKLEAPSRPTLMAWLTSAWEGLPAATLESGFRKLNIPTDNRVLPSRDPVLHDRDIDDLVDRLEALRWCEEVGTDFGL
ncbi:DNA binding protein [Phytophthora megakarya]|uniref:DNA binding protein n=1 Tax=Phytophthora megakarya TaxID=4795 RepID=A0A225VBG2_9STRA|nr:DNA binding protein [Phytophthora megakarya]